MNDNKECIKILVDYDYEFEKNDKYSTTFDKLIAIRTGEYSAYGRIYVQVNYMGIYTVEFKILSDMLRKEKDYELIKELLNEFGKELEKIKPYFVNYYNDWK